MTDYTRLLGRLDPKPDGEQPTRHRSGVVDTVNSDGTVDVEVSGVVIPSVSVLEGASVGVGDTVQIVSWAGDLLVLGRARSAPGGGMTTIDQIDLDSVTTFTGIPQTFTDLVVEIQARSTTALVVTTMVMTINGLTGIYSYHEWKLDNVTVSATTIPGNAGQARIATISAANANASTFANVEVVIPRYTDLVIRAGRSRSSVIPFYANVTSQVEAHYGFSLNNVTAAVTSLEFITVGAFAAGSVATLYGRG